MIAVTGFYTEAALICLQARSLGIDVPFIGGDGWEAPQLIELGGKAVEGTTTPRISPPKTTRRKSALFVQKFKTRWNNGFPRPCPRSVTMRCTHRGRHDERRHHPKAPARDAIAATKNFPV